jgi:steroid 5-alpha reductase family enzyme
MPLLLQSFLLILSVMTFVWIVSLIRRDAGIIDPCWGMGFIIVAGFVAWKSANPLLPRGMLILILTAVWGLRLSVHLLLRNWGHAEDRRYRAMRDHHGPRFWWVSLLTVFWLQAVILWIVSLPVQMTILNTEPRSLHWLDAVGALLWGVGLFFEAVGDFQLARFQANPANAGRVMDRGLWRYTRHPNYFGDFCVWWGLFMISVNAGAAWTVFAPLLMSFLLMKVSGVTLLERSISSRRPEYAEYQRQTNAFVPGPPILSKGTFYFSE